MNKKFNRFLTVCLLMMAIVVAPFSALGSAQLGIAMAQADSWHFNPASGHYYRLTEPTTWFDAEAQAVVWGGHLVTLDNAEEELWVKDTFGRLEHFWIGFNDIDEEGIWVWSSGALVTYTNWAEGEPSNCCPCTEYPGCEDVAVMNWQPDSGGSSFGDFWNDEPPDDSYGLLRGIVERGYLQVSIDIKPDDYPNYINNNDRGVIPVAILTTESFDASTVDPFSLSLDGAGARVKGKSGNAGTLEDVDYDGDQDLMVHIEDTDGTYSAGCTIATLTGMTYDGTPIKGQDTICIVP